MFGPRGPIDRIFRSLQQLPDRTALLITLLFSATIVFVDTATYNISNAVNEILLNSVLVATEELMDSVLMANEELLTSMIVVTETWLELHFVFIETVLDGIGYATSLTMTGIALDILFGMILITACVAFSNYFPEHDSFVSTAISVMLMIWTRVRNEGHL